MTIGRIMSVSVLPPQGKHPEKTDDEQALQALIEMCGLTAVYEPDLVMFRLWDEQTQRFYDMGVQADFYVVELGLYVELTGKPPKNLKRKLEQVELMLASGFSMLLIESLSWAEINGSHEFLLGLLMASAKPVPALVEAAA